MKGSCLCGAVVYEAEAPGLLIGHCSCRTCRKAHAAPFTATARVPRDKFKWLAGADKLRAFESSPGKNRHFCSICGSHLIAERPAEPHVILRVATLDEDPRRETGCPYLAQPRDALARLRRGHQALR